jgi:pyruvate/2-oxoglutarate dehydrogenase complex dihydrolipoamide acyltransferase (E2) component
MQNISLFRNKGDKIVRLEPWRKVVADGFQVVRKPDACAVWLQDLLAATQFRDRFRREKAVPLTYPTMLIRACALALRKYPRFHSSVFSGKLVTPGSIDVGVSVTGPEILAPVVVIREADTKSLQEIVKELREKGRQAREQQQQELKKLNKIGTWLPPLIRRRLVAWALRNPALRRTYVGTFQISVLSDFPGFIMPMFLSATFLMVMCGVAKRPVVVEDQLEIRPTAYLILAADHNLTAGKHFVDFVREIQHLLLNPEELDD